MPTDPKVNAENELAEDELGKVSGGLSISHEKVKKDGQKVGLEKKAHNMVQKAGMENMRAHKELDSDD